jgi:hypothetical protein
MVINMMPQDLPIVLDRLNVEFAAVADLESGNIQFIGQPESVGNTDLITALFSDRDSVESLNRSLEGQMLPRAWSQGKVTCIICKPSTLKIVGLFVMDERDAVEQYHWSKIANEAIQSSFSSSET